MSMRRLVLGAVCAVALGAAASAAPAPATKITTAPAGQADVYRDHFGVPHIYASREADGFYALGYVEAEDSAYAIQAMALGTEGRAASVLGTGSIPWSGPAATVDKEALRWRVAEQGKAAYARLPQNLKAQVDAYTAGFNAYLKAHPDKAIAGFALQPWHSIAWPHAVLMFFNVGDGLRKCVVDGAKLASSGYIARSASNEWAIAGSRTADGRTYLLSDPHGEIPVGGNPFYEYRMKAGELNVTGYAFGFSPALVHSPKVAWGLTTGGPDVSDCYKLKVEGGRYSLGGQWRDFDVRRHTIEVKGAAPVHVEYRYAQINGAPAPVVGDKDGYAYAVSTPYWGHFEDMFIQFDRMIRAQDADGVLKAAEIQGLFPQNIVAADSKGSLIYIRGGRTPIRASGADWTKALPGDDPASQWKGIHKLQDLVIVRNPRTGYLQNNNTRPDNISKDRSLVREADYPGYIWNDNPTSRFMDRGNRVNEVLDAAHGFTVQDAEHLALDEKWWFSEHWTALLARAAEAHPEIVAGFDDDARRVLDRLKTFDGFAHSTSVAALNHNAWRTALWANFGKDHREVLEKAVVAETPPDDEVLRAALAAVPAAVKTLHERLGSVDHPYGDWFRIGRSKDRHWPVGGGISLEMANMGECPLLQEPAFVCTVTPRAYGFARKTADGKVLAVGGSRALRLVALGKDFASYSLHNFGQSDDPTSPHYDDQARDLSSKDRLKRIPFTPEELAKDVSSHERLTVSLPR
jgi:acyl-homoserine lactone acylase PvdQ